MTYKGLVISDIHVGATKPNNAKLRSEFLELFISYIIDMERLDFLVVTGDFFDHRFYLDSDEARTAYLMLKDMVTVCKKKGTVIRLVYGTESHESNQYDILSLLKIYDKIELVKYAKEEELLPGIWVLYLPEEHLMDAAKYYQKFFENEKKYDYIFGHGVIREVMKDEVIHMESNKASSNRKKVPIFASKDLLRICKGQVYFGHYHINQELEDGKIISVGSFSRWKYGEEGRKGFYEVTYDCGEKGISPRYQYKYLENGLADQYETVRIEITERMCQDTSDLYGSLQNLSQRYLDPERSEHKRFIFTIPSSLDTPESTIDVIREAFKENSTVKIDVEQGYLEEKRKQQKEELDIEEEKYSFLHEDLSVEDTVYQFIVVEYNKEIPVERISNYLYKQLSEILQEPDAT